MEGLAWLLIKMAVFLALTGAAFFALGWWLRGRQAAPQASVAPPPSGEIEQFKSAAIAAEKERDVLQNEVTSLKSQLAAAEEEARRLASLQAAQPPVAVNDQLMLHPPPPPEEVKPKPRRKPRAKKTKA